MIGGGSSRLNVGTGSAASEVYTKHLGLCESLSNLLYPYHLNSIASSRWPKRLFFLVLGVLGEVGYTETHNAQSARKTTRSPPYPPIAQEQVPSNHCVSSVVIGRKNRASLKVESVNSDAKLPRHPYGFDRPTILLPPIVLL